MIIVCYIEDFIVWRLVKSRFHSTDHIPSQAELMNSIIENWVSLPISAAKLKAENPKQYSIWYSYFDWIDAKKVCACTMSSEKLRKHL